MKNKNFKLKFMAFALAFSAMCFFGIKNTYASNKKEACEVNIAMATDKNYIYPTVVSICSILENKNPETKINFYVMLSGDFLPEEKEKISKIVSLYKGADLKLINMDDRFKKAKTSGHITTAAYFRLNLPSLLPNVDILLYMDTDTIVKKDLSELCNVNIGENYVAGVNHGSAKRKDENFFGKGKRTTYINSGIMLMNLKKMRKDNLEKSFEEFINGNLKNKKWTQHDQDVVNAVCYGKIKILPMKFNFMQHEAGKSGMKFWYGEKEFEEQSKDPVIVHFSSNIKPWKHTELPLANLWWEYAEKTPFKEEIKEAFLNIK